MLYEKLKYAQEKIDTLQSQLSELQNAKEQLTKIFESQVKLKNKKKIKKLIQTKKLIKFFRLKASTLI